MLDNNNLFDKNNFASLKYNNSTNTTSSTTNTTISRENSNNTENITNEINKTYTYPDVTDNDLQSIIMKKREFYYYKTPNRKILTSYDDIMAYRKSICSPSTFSLQGHQIIPSNYINPNTLYKGLIFFHGLGTGKTCGAIAVAEGFKEQVQKYNTKIYILLPGPLMKESWKEHLLKCTGDTYTKFQDQSVYVNLEEKIKNDYSNYWSSRFWKNRTSKGT